MIDLSDGATGQISNNWFVQGRNKENHTAMITVAPENRWHSSNGLVVTGNDARFAPGADFETAFVADWSGDTLDVADNTLARGLKSYERR
jgi:hypothetical protein